MAGKGGRREGAGRPKGALSRKTQEIVDLALSQGVTPMDVMLGTMRKLWESATTTDPVIIATLPVSQHELAMQAVEVAAKCAPYCHPKLVSQEIKAEVHTTELPNVDANMFVVTPETVDESN